MCGGLSVTRDIGHITSVFFLNTTCQYDSINQKKKHTQAKDPTHMIDLRATTRSLITRALSTAPTHQPWACISTPTSDLLLVYRVTPDNNSGKVNAVRITPDENPTDVYNNIESGSDTRRALPASEAADILSQGAEMIESPALSLLVLNPPKKETLLTIMTPDSVLIVGESARSKRDIQSGRIRDDVREEIVFKN